MGFSQLDRSITGDEPATCLTDPVLLKVGTQVETVRFIVVPRMTEPMVLRLVGWKKWNPSVSCDREKW